MVNRKINKYDKAVSNPFEAVPLTITLVWVEENNKDKNQDNLYK